MATEKTSKKENSTKAPKDLKVRILLPVAGMFLLPYNIDQEVTLPFNQAMELIDAKYAEKV